MNFSTYLPILVALGLVILPELSKNSAQGCCNQSCACTPQCCCPEPNPCLPDTNMCTHGQQCMPSVNSCLQMSVDLCGVKFKNSPEDICCCRLWELQSLTDNGYETWRRDPAAVSARFMQSCFIDPCFRGCPPYFAGECKSCDKTYIVLGVGCVGKMIFELCQPAKIGSEGIWIVTRYGKYNN